jgi:hypothetical protein
MRRSVLLLIFPALLFCLQSPQPAPEPKECDPHICHCKGMQDGNYDDAGKPVCKTSCKRNACCCPKVDTR